MFDLMFLNPCLLLLRLCCCLLGFGFPFLLFPAYSLLWFCFSVPPGRFRGQNVSAGSDDPANLSVLDVTRPQTLCFS